MWQMEVPFLNAETSLVTIIGTSRVTLDSIYCSIEKEKKTKQHQLRAVFCCFTSDVIFCFLFTDIARRAYIG